MLDYCSFYVNKLRKFDHLALSIPFIMRIIDKKEFEENYMMNLDEYEADFILNFPQLELEKLTNDQKETFLINTQKYYRMILIKFRC